MPLPSAGGTDCSSGLSARIFNNFRYDNPWQASQGGVVVGTLCCPTVPAGIGFRCTAITTGITGGSEPTWPTILTNMVVDGGVTWTAQDVANPSGKTHPPTSFFGYALTSADLDGFRVLAYNTAQAVAAELTADNAAWAAPTLGGGFTNLGAGFQPAGYYQDFTGRIYGRGILTNAGGCASGTTIYTLPVGYRPVGDETFAVILQGGFAKIDVTPAGLVVVNTIVGAGQYLAVPFNFDTR